MKPNELADSLGGWAQRHSNLKDGKNYQRGLSPDEAALLATALRLAEAQDQHSTTWHSYGSGIEQITESDRARDAALAAYRAARGAK